MDVAGLKAHIKSNTLAPILIFTGDEWAVMDIFIKQISKVKDMDVKRVDSISTIVPKLKSTSFIKQNFIYIARDDSVYMQDEKLQTLLPNVIGDNMYILLLTNVDKRTKFYKANADNIVAFEALPEKMLIKYIQRELPLSEAKCKRLIEVCEESYGRCLLEINKIKKYAKGMNYTQDDKVWNHVLDELLEDGTIYTPPKDAIFEFVDAILDRQIKCFDLYEQCKAVGEATLVMISVLYNNAKAVLQVQTCQSKDVSKSTGLTGWQIMNAKKHIGKYSAYELLRIMKECIKCEQGIKTGKIEEQYAMEYIMVNIL